MNTNDTIIDLAFSGLSASQMLMSISEINELTIGSKSYRFQDCLEDSSGIELITELIIDSDIEYSSQEELVEIAEMLIAFITMSCDETIKQAKEIEEITNETHWIKRSVNLLSKIESDSVKLIGAEKIHAFLSDPMDPNLTLPERVFILYLTAYALQEYSQLRYNDYTIIQASLDVIEAIENSMFD